MPPSFSGGLLCAMAAVAASTSADAKTPDSTQFIAASLANAPHSPAASISVAAIMPQAIRSGKRSHPRGPALRFEFQAFSAKRNDHRLIASPAEFACRSAQKPLSRNMVELQPDAVGIFEQQRIISRRPLILARRANDRHTERTQEAVQLVNVGARGHENTDDAGRRDSARTQ